MQEIDEKSASNGASDEHEEDMFLREVINEDHELLYLDTFLREALGSE